MLKQFFFFIVFSVSGYCAQNTLLNNLSNELDSETARIGQYSRSDLLNAHRRVIQRTIQQNPPFARILSDFLQTLDIVENQQIFMIQEYIFQKMSAMMQNAFINGERIAPETTGEFAARVQRDPNWKVGMQVDITLDELLLLLLTTYERLPAVVTRDDGIRRDRQLYSSIDTIIRQQCPNCLILTQKINDLKRQLSSSAELEIVPIRLILQNWRAGHNQQVISQQIQTSAAHSWRARQATLRPLHTRQLAYSIVTAGGALPTPAPIIVVPVIAPAQPAPAAAPAPQKKDDKDKLNKALVNTGIAAVVGGWLGGLLGPKPQPSPPPRERFPDDYNASQRDTWPRNRDRDRYDNRRLDKRYDDRYDDRRGSRQSGKRNDYPYSQLGKHYDDPDDLPQLEKHYNNRYEDRQLDKRYNDRQLDKQYNERQLDKQYNERQLDKRYDDPYDNRRAGGRYNN